MPTHFESALPATHPLTDAHEGGVAGLFGTAASAIELLIARVSAPLRAVPLTLSRWVNPQAAEREAQFETLIAAVRALEQRLDQLEAAALAEVEPEPAPTASRKARQFGHALERAKQVADARGLSAGGANRARKPRR